MPQQTHRTTGRDQRATTSFSLILTAALVGLAGIVVLVAVSAYFNLASTDQGASTDETQPGIIQLVPGPNATQPHPATVASDDLLFTADFGSNANGWDVNSVQSRWLDWSFTAGKLRVARTPAVVPFAGLMRFCLPIPNRAFADFRLSLDARSESSTAGTGYGIFVDRASDETRYYFGLDSYGMYSVFVEEQVPALHPEFIQEPTTLSIVNVGDTNQITVSAAGSTMIFYVNGVEVAQVTDAQVGPGSIGLFVEVVPGSGDETWVEFSNLIVRKL